MSATEICNQALSYLGSYEVNDITTPRSDIEKVCSRWYDDTRRACLREGLLNSAVYTKKIPADVETPISHWSYQYTLPNDCVRLLGISSSKFESYDFENGKLVCNIAPEDGLYIRYIGDLKDTTRFNSLFKEYLALKLAYNMCYQITKKSEKLTQIKQMMDMAYNNFNVAEGQENRPVIINNSKYRNARISGNYPYKRYKR